MISETSSSTSSHPQSPRRMWARRLFLFLLVSSLLWLMSMIALMVVTVEYGQVERAEPADVIIVLGAGTLRDGRAGPALTQRSRKGAELWSAGYAPNILCTGGQAPRRPNSEASACRAVLLQAGVSADAIWLEPDSRSTEENALFSVPILRENDWQTAIVVSDDYHLLRAGSLFSGAGIDHTLSPVPARQRLSSSSYLYSLVREVVAWHWHIAKTVLGLPFTHFP